MERRGVARCGIDPVDRPRGVPGDPKAQQSRYLEAAMHGIMIACILPAKRQPAEPEVRLQARMNRAITPGFDPLLRKCDDVIVLLNVVHESCDNPRLDPGIRHHLQGKRLIFIGNPLHTDPGYRD